MKKSKGILTPAEKKVEKRKKIIAVLVIILLISIVANIFFFFDQKQDFLSILSSKCEWVQFGYSII